MNALKRVSTPGGTLLDETLAMYVSENGDGDSHARKNMPILLAGHAGVFQTGRAVAARFAGVSIAAHPHPVQARRGTASRQFDKIPDGAYIPPSCPGGGIGRRARFRSVCRKA